MYKLSGFVLVYLLHREITGNTIKKFNNNKWPVSRYFVRGNLLGSQINILTTLIIFCNCVIIIGFRQIN